MQGLGLIGTLLAWLEEAAKRPAAAHRDVLLEAAVLLSGLVRTRAELMRLVGKVSDSQLEAEKLAAGAVRIHLGLLERITSEAAPQPPQVGSLSDACRQWRQVIEQLTASRPAASPGGAGYAGDFYAWRSMRPGATRAEEVSVAVSGSTTVPFPFAAYPGALVQPALGQRPSGPPSLSPCLLPQWHSKNGRCLGLDSFCSKRRHFCEYLVYWGPPLRFYSAASAVEMPASVHAGPSAPRDCYYH